MNEWHVQAPIKHRMTRRLHGWDYSQRAIYMVTVTLADRTREWLGHLTKNGEIRNTGEARDGFVPPHSCGEWAIAPTPYGKAVLEALFARLRGAPRRRAGSGSALRGGAETSLGTGGAMWYAMAQIPNPSPSP